jgi:hypothetical protein
MLVIGVETPDDRLPGVDITHSKLHSELLRQLVAFGRTDDECYRLVEERLRQWYTDGMFTDEDVRKLTVWSENYPKDTPASERREPYAIA